MFEIRKAVVCRPISVPDKIGIPYVLVGRIIGVFAVLACSAIAAGESSAGTHVSADARVPDQAHLRGGRLPNNFPFLNGAGTAATFSTAGFVDLGNPFHLPQGTNGRSCESCHLVQAGWSIRPIDVELKFLLSGGTDPIFNPLDANSPTPDESSWAKRYASYSMLRKGLFRRGGNVPANAEYEITAVDDPLGAGGSLTRFEAFRRPLATANFHIARNVGWHDQNTNGSSDLHLGLAGQVAGNVTGSQQGSPASAETIESIVVYEEGLRFAQQSVFGLGSLTACGGQGGAENLSAQPPINGRFNLYDAWIGLVPGSCGPKSADRKRTQIARGQEIFNSTNANGRSCRGCHNAANNGSNVNGTLFDIGASKAELREPGMPLYTLRKKNTEPAQLRQTTDPGRAIRSGLWADIDKFKVPSMRGLAARPPYFHNGIAKTLNDVVRHYEVAMDFEYTQQEREDLVAFMEAL
jgi:cytochrome c peroxidase